MRSPQQWLTQPRVTQRQRLRQPYLSSRKQPIRLSPRHPVKQKTSCRTSQRNTLPADGQVIGQVMPGVRGANAPVVADNAPSRDVKLTFAQIAPPPGSMVLRGRNTRWARVLFSAAFAVFALLTWAGFKSFLTGFAKVVSTVAFGSSNLFLLRLLTLLTSSCWLSPPARLSSRLRQSSPASTSSTR